MDDELRNYIRNNPYIYSYLREDSSHYKYLYQDRNYIKTLEKLAKKKYTPNINDRINKIKDNIELINNIIDILK